MPEGATYYIGIDVGTGSARAALVTTEGVIVAESTHATKLFRNPRDYRHFEQSTTDIWHCICQAVRDTLAESHVNAQDIKGIGVDATCSLAVTDMQGRPVSVSDGDFRVGAERNIVLWADHRAEKETDLINSTGSDRLKYVGGTVSIEMEVPKMMWLKNHMPPELWAECQFFDLSDWITYQMTGDNTRSTCSVTCKQTFLTPGVNDSKVGWSPDLFEKIGFGVMKDSEYYQVGGIPGSKGREVLTAGQPVGQGLSEKSATELGLVPGIAVGSGLIDAYAGWVGTVAAKAPEEKIEPSFEESEHRLAVIAGTSTCHIVQSKSSVFVKGVWGPFADPVFPGYWMNEAGQSSTGQLIDFVLETHPAIDELHALAKERKTNIFNVLEDILKDLLRKSAKPSNGEAKTLSFLTRHLHLYPDYHGNRSPLADPKMRGVLVGLTLAKGIEDLALRYYATLEAIALQTRHIIEELNAKGHKITAMYMSGGHVKNPLLLHLMASATRVPVHLPSSTTASVVLGAAILGACAYESTKSGKADGKNLKLWDLMVQMTKAGGKVDPGDARGSGQAADCDMAKVAQSTDRLLDTKYKIFHEMITSQRKWRSMVNAVVGSENDDEV